MQSPRNPRIAYSFDYFFLRNFPAEIGFRKKKEIDERAEAQVFVLNEDERINEIARIIGGIDLTEKQFGAARELIIQSSEIVKKYKK
jgi:hypothetical protein